jgi:hypothetical protein
MLESFYTKLKKYRKKYLQQFSIPEGTEDGYFEIDYTFSMECGYEGYSEELDEEFYDYEDFDFTYSVSVRDIITYWYYAYSKEEDSWEKKFLDVLNELIDDEFMNILLEDLEVSSKEEIFKALSDLVKSSRAYNLFDYLIHIYDLLDDDKLWEDLKEAFEDKAYDEACSEYAEYKED